MGAERQLTKEEGQSAHTAGIPGRSFTAAGGGARQRAGTWGEQVHLLPSTLSGQGAFTHSALHSNTFLCSFDWHTLELTAYWLLAMHSPGLGM